MSAPTILTDAELAIGTKHADWGWRPVFDEADVERIVVARVTTAVDRERAAWAARIEAHAAEIEAGLVNDGHLMTSHERKSQRHAVIGLRSLLLP